MESSGSRGSAAACVSPRPALPWGIGFAAGAMVFMVFVELLPEAYEDAPRPAIGLVASLTLVAMLLFQRYL